MNNTRNLPHKLRQAVLDRDGRRCVDCGAPQHFNYAGGRSSLHVHHVVEYVNGGKHEMSNLVSLCVKCHYKRDEAHRRKMVADTAKKRADEWRAGGYIPIREACQLLAVSRNQLIDMMKRRDMSVFANRLHPSDKYVSRAEVLKLKEPQERAA